MYPNLIIHRSTFGAFGLARRLLKAGWTFIQTSKYTRHHGVRMVSPSGRHIVCFK